MDEKHIDLAEHFLKLNNPKRALDELAKVEQFSMEYWYFRAWANYKLENFEKSKKFLLLALKEDPDDLQALYLLTQAERRMKNFKEAEKHISRVIELYPDHAGSRELYAIVMMKLNKNASMKKAFTEAKRLRGENQNNLLNATTEFMKGKLKKAIENIELALIDEPDNPLANSLAAKYYQKSWQYGKAFKRAIHALRLEPSNKEYQEQVRSLKTLNHPFHKPFAQIIYINKKKHSLPVIVLSSILTIIYLIGIFSKKPTLAIMAVSLGGNIIVSFAAYGFISFVFAKIYYAIKED